MYQQNKANVYVCCKTAALHLLCYYESRLIRFIRVQGMQLGIMGNRKRKAFLVAMSSLFFMGQANASWLAHSKDFTNWEKGITQDCTEWFPSSDVVDWGVKLVQTRQCKIKEVRHQIVYEKSKLSGEVRERKREPQSRFSIRKERRQTQGTLDHLIEVVKDDTWTDWYDVKGALRNCADRVDVSLDGDLYSGVVDFQYCEQEVERRIPITEHWLSGNKVRRLEIESVERKWTPRALTWSNVGKKDRWLHSRREYGPWSFDGEPKDCYSPNWGAISPEVPWGNHFTSWVKCKKEQIRSVKTVRHSLSGKKKIINVEQEKRVSPLLYTQTSIGEKDFVVAVENNSVISEWEPEVLKADDCSADMLVLSNLEWGKSVTTYKTCSIKERFTTGTKETMASGRVNVKNESFEFRETEIFLVESGVGNYDYLIERTDKFRYGTWKAESNWDCGAWLPLPHNVSFDKTYTQSRRCKMSRSRSVERLVRWESGDKWNAASRSYGVIEKSEFKFESGLKLEKYALPEFSLRTLAGGGVSSEMLNVASDIDFQRVNIQLDFDDEDLTKWKNISITLVGPNGNIFDIPIIRSGVALFFELEKYSETPSGNWVMKVKDKREDGDPFELTVKLNLQQTAPKKVKPIEI